MHEISAPRKGLREDFLPLVFHWVKMMSSFPPYQYGYKRAPFKKQKAAPGQHRACRDLCLGLPASKNRGKVIPEMFSFGVVFLI